MKTAFMPARPLPHSAPAATPTNTLDNVSHNVFSLPLPRLSHPCASAEREAACQFLAAPTDTSRGVYEKLQTFDTDRDATAALAGQYLRAQLATLPPAGNGDDLPESPQELLGWMVEHHGAVTAAYESYLAERKAGAPRRFFTNRAHALYFLRAVAPTKLVDGAWLYGLVRHWKNPRFHELLKTYVEELGDGDPGKNHVVLYRQLLQSHGLEAWQDQAPEMYVQGAIQLALAHAAEDFLPEVVGFNLGYEQLPLHLLITAYELNELGIDPYYFTLHVTVDNADTGHAQRAVQAVADTLPQVADATAFWQRVRAGYRLNDLGASTTSVIADFRIEDEVVNIFRRKSSAGRGAHSDYCRVAGRTVNDWLAQPDDIPAFLAALQKAGWINLGQPVQESRFWGLLQGERAEMFGVFSDYELQVIHDWVRGDASRDGLPFREAVPARHDATPLPATRRPSFRARLRAQATGRGTAPAADAGRNSRTPHDLLDPDLQALQHSAHLPAEQREALLVHAMSPASHWTPAGLYATREFMQALG